MTVNVQEVQMYQIKEVTEKDAEVIQFVMNMRNELFPMMEKNQLPVDLLHFNEYYVQAKGAAFFAAFTENQQVIGTIGLYAYDGRFHALKKRYEHKTAAEIVKCYVDPAYRRLGIGQQLLKAVEQFAQSHFYDTLYLHTHPFLPGAIPFWTSQDFIERLAEQDEPWNTLHMDRKIQPVVM